MLRVGIDIGGTFTDFVAIDEASGRVETLKVLTTPKAPTEAVIAGLEEIVATIGANIGEVGIIIHGTTLATNAIVERKGAATALLVTDGFSDVLAIGRERRYDIYDIQFRVPSPLVPRERCWGVRERVASDGEVVVALDAELFIQDIESRLASHPVDAVAICFLHSHMNSHHEQVASAALQRAWPGLFVSTSSDVAAEVGEYERASTVAVNAYIQPVIKAYLATLTEQLEARGLRGRLFIMLSNGGLTTPDVAERRPIGIIESGPAGGVQAACSIARTLGRAGLIAFDMGGTTAKICLVRDGEPSTSNDFEVGRLDWSKPGSGFPVKAPFIEMIEIGTGGGSIASVNSLGLIAVGPTSAGADPGPACYDRGGVLPTVTDADLVLGYLRANWFAGGAFTLNEEKAHRAIAEHVAEPLGITVEHAATAIHELANESMANAARLHAAQRGVGLAGYTLVASGGAGPVHATELARKLRLTEIVFPFAAGVASALGFLLSPVSFQVSRSFPQLLSRVDYAKVNSMLEAMEYEASSAVASGGIDPNDIHFSYTCSMSYVGQAFSIEVLSPARRITVEEIAAFNSAFEQRYRELYCALIPDLPVQVTTWRVTASGPLPKFEPLVATSSLSNGTEMGRRRRAFDPQTGTFQQHTVFDRELLPSGSVCEGPAIIEARESTIIIGRGASARVDDFGNVVTSLGSVIGDQGPGSYLEGARIL